MAILKKKENTGAGSAAGGGAAVGGGSAATNTAEPSTQSQQSTVLGGTSSFGDQNAAIGATTVAATPQREQSKAGYTSGQQYLNVNQDAAKKLGDQIANPLNQRATQIQESAQQKALEQIGRAGESTFNQDYLDKAGQDARTLSDEERQSVEDTLSGAYGGPNQYVNDIARQEVRQLTEDVGQLQTVSGISQALSDRGQAGNRKYSAGMRNFDAALMRQDPNIRETFAQQRNLGETTAAGLDTQRQSVLDAIAEGQGFATDRQTAARDQFGNIQTGQETAWNDALAALQADSGLINENLRGELAMSQDQLDLLGMTAQEYDDLRNSYITTSYGEDRYNKGNAAGFVDENYNVTNYGDRSRLSPKGVAGNYFRNLQLDKYAIDQGTIDSFNMQNVAGGDDVARYKALNSLRGAQDMEGIGGLFNASPTDLSQYYNKDAMFSGRDAFMTSNIDAPQSNYDYTGGGRNRPTSPAYSTQAPDGSRRNPLTGQILDRFEYAGPKTGDKLYGIQGATQEELNNRGNYNYDTSIDQGNLDRRNQVSGYVGDRETFAEGLAPLSPDAKFGYQGTYGTNNGDTASWLRNNEYGPDVAFGDQPKRT